MFHPLIKKKVHTVDEFAHLVGVSRYTVMAWIEKQTLKAHRVGGRYYIPDTELQRLIKEAQ